MRTAVVVFPGSTCDRDGRRAVAETLKTSVEMVWHEEREFASEPDLVILPGGFSYGDYLRSGAMAARSPIIEAVRRHAEAGKLLLGICNGFQVLTETKLLPGALRYADPKTGSAGAEYAPNGALNGIAGICNKGGNILGLMPHPERSTVAHLNGGTDGGDFWRSIAQDFAKREAL